MNSMVTNEEKKSFVGWFLKHYELKKRESAWLLTYLMSDEKLLQNVKFVDEVHKSQRFIVMSTKCVPHIPFQFRKGKIVSTDVEKAFHDIRLNSDEITHVQLLFHEAKRSPEYAAVREIGTMPKEYLRANSLYSLLAEMVLDEAVENFEKQKILEDIENSLQERDEQRFLALTNRLKELEQ